MMSDVCGSFLVPMYLLGMVADQAFAYGHWARHACHTAASLDFGACVLTASCWPVMYDTTTLRGRICGFTELPGYVITQYVYHPHYRYNNFSYIKKLGFAPQVARDDEKKSDLNSSLTAKLGKGGISAKTGAIPLELTFTNHTNKVQMFTNAEYRYDLFDKDGQQVELAKKKVSFIMTKEL